MDLICWTLDIWSTTTLDYEEVQKQVVRANQLLLISQMLLLGSYAPWIHSDILILVCDPSGRLPLPGTALLQAFN